MKIIIKISLAVLSILLLLTFFVTSIYSDTLECDNNTIIVSVCTGDMRALETGVSVYAGFNDTPLILSDKTLPEQLKKWLPGYIHENNITRILVVGPVTAEQLMEFRMMKTEVKQVKGGDIPEILTKIAKNSYEIRKDSVILTASDPLAGELGAYMKLPVFVTASNSTYSSSEYLDEDYMDYILENNIKKVILVGNLPDTIKTQLKENDISYEELSGSNSLEVSKNVNNKLISEGYVNNRGVAYYGFYGELPTIVPNVVKNNALLLEDSSNSGDILSYLTEKNITTVIVTRNARSDYIQMEETDYVSSEVIETLEKNNITVKYLTRKRTLDEATGLYDMKIMTVENMNTNSGEMLNDTNDKIVPTEPPLIAMLNSTECVDSNNISAEITKNSGGIMVKWDTIHPYMWTEMDENHFHATSNTGYEYTWTKQNNTWDVRYYLDKKEYYNVTWIENSDNSWTEVQHDTIYSWKYDGIRWKCYNTENQLIYYISNE